MHRRDFVALGAAIPAAASGVTLGKTSGPDGKGITAIGVLRLRPGDVVVLTCPGAISDEDGKRLQEALDSILPSGVRAAVLAEGLQLGVIRSDA